VRVVRNVAIVVGLALPPAVLALVLWPDSPEGGADTTGVAFEDPVDEVHSVEIEVDGGSVLVTLRPDFASVCFELQSFNAGSATCGTLRDLARVPLMVNFTGDSTVEVAGLTVPESERLVIIGPDGGEVEGVVAELPGRPERVYLGRASFDGAGGGNATMQLLDGDGDVIEEARV
jgi:hypothetical protein